MSDVTTEISEGAAQLLVKAWQGEVYGVDVYSALADARTVPLEAVKLRTVVALEVTMRHQLTEMLDSLGIPQDLGDVMEVAERETEEQRHSPWPDLMKWIGDDAQVALNDYLPLDDMSVDWDADDRAVALEVIAHEKAIISFCTKELAGEIDSLAEVEALSHSTPAE